MKTFKQLLEAILSESSRPKNNLSSGNIRLPEPPPEKSGPSIFDPDPDEEAAWGEYKKRKGIEEKQLGPDAKFGDAGPMPGRERFQFQQEYLKTLTPEKRKAYDERQRQRSAASKSAFAPPKLNKPNYYY